MNEQEFLELWEYEAPMYQAWGDYITALVVNRLKEKCIDRHGSFLKIPPEPRIKTPQSLLDKAFYRDKGYSDPYNDITDKVGVRFVVLLVEDIKLIEQVLKELAFISCSKDRDYEKERYESPLEFTYQSVHYVVRLKENIEFAGHTLLEGLPCEIQIRTLLQHAHSELTHDNVYKPTSAIKADPSVLRVVARSMALIESADECFDSVVTKLRELERPFRNALEVLEDLYREATGAEPQLERFNSLILESCQEFLSLDLEDKLRDFLAEKSYIGERVLQHSQYSHVFRQASVILVYFAVWHRPSVTKEKWPLIPDDLNTVFVDLGRNFDQY